MAVSLIFWRKDKPPITEKEWVLASLGWAKYAHYAVQRYGYRLWPEFRKITFLNFLLVVAQLVLVIAAVFTPLAFAKFVAPALGVPPDEVTKWTTIAFYQTLILATVAALRALVDVVKSYDGRAKERLRNLFEISVALEQAIDVISQQIESFSKTPAAQEKRDAFMANALKCIEATVRLCTENNDKQYCCVSLLTFEPGGEVKVRARSDSAGRRVGGRFSQETTIAWSAAKYAKQSFTIYYFKKASKIRKINKLEYRSLSNNGKPLYESILALPLPPVVIPGQNKKMRKGVVTIDSGLPYEFLGKEADILSRTQAYLNLINLMLTSHHQGIEPEI